MALIIADTREKNGANPYLETCILENNKKNSKLTIGGEKITYEEKQLTVGDYSILVESKTTPGEYILAIVLERKTWKDLSASIKDGRVIEQQKKLEGIKKNKGCKVYFIIEGAIGYPDDRMVANIPFKNLHAKIRHGLLRDFPFIQTKDQLATAKLIVNFARDVLKLYDTLVPAFQRLSPAEEYVQKLIELNTCYAELIPPEMLVGIPELAEPTEPVGSSEAPESVLVELQTRVIHSDSDIIEKMWRAIPGVSEKTAPILMNKYRLSDILCAGPGKIKLLKTEIADLKYPSGTRLGETRAKAILEITKGGTAAAKLLACIPGVSKQVAEIITNTYDLKSLCDGSITSDDIAALKKPSDRRIGEKLAEKITNILQISVAQNT